MKKFSTHATLTFNAESEAEVREVLSKIEADYGVNVFKPVINEVVIGMEGDEFGTEEFTR